MKIFHLANCCCLIFGVLFIPKIIKKISEKNVITSNRTVKPGYESLDYIKLDG